jgi:hypothetical protein
MPTPIQDVSSYETIGEFSTPVTADQVTDTLGVLDGGVHVLAELFKAAINAELTDVWQKIVGVSGGTDGVIGTKHPLYNTLPVADTLELEPSQQVMTQRHAVWPLLCVHRVGKAEYTWTTIEIQRRIQQWNLHYILGPVDIADLHKLSKVCIGVAGIVSMVLRDYGHKAYKNGETQFFQGSGAHFAWIWLKSHEGPGNARFNEGDQTIYYAITMGLETAEDLTDTQEAFADFDAVDYSIGVGDELEIVPDLVEANTDAPYQDP